MKNYGLDTLLDVLVVGAGPAGLAVLHAAQQEGLAAVALDKGPVASALCSHPTYMRWFSTADKLALGGFPLLSEEKNPTRREYLKYCRAFARYFGLRVNTYREVTAITPTDEGFAVHARDLFGRAQAWRARRVVVATGFYDSPRPLGVPGDDLPKVRHRYTEAHWYSDHEVLIVGAGSSAAEVALELFREEARVTVVMRSDRFHTKYWIEPDIENRIREGSIACYRNSELVAIEPDAVRVRDGAGAETSVPNDFVLALTGYAPDTALIEAAGAAIDHTCGKPVLSEALESTVPGLYVAGTLCAGQESNVVFVENSRDHGPLIVKDILCQRSSVPR